MLPPFLHTDPVQFAFNMTTLLVAVGLLELVIGTTFMGTFYIAGILCGNIFTTILLTPILGVYDFVLSLFSVQSEALLHFLGSPDVGCSLGVLSCVGALMYLARQPKAIGIFVVITSIAGAIFTGQIMFLNHTVACAIGYFLARRALN
jgi:membrane associated rhomboid family serine protease